MSLFEETDKWDGVDFTDVLLYEDGEPLDISSSKQIIIDRMIDLRIKDAKGLGDYWQEPKEELALEEDTQSIPFKSEAELAPTLAKLNFQIATNMPTPEQAKQIIKEKIVARDLEI